MARPRLHGLTFRIYASFVAGVVLHCGEGAMTFGDRHVALPLSALWSPLVGEAPG